MHDETVTTRIAARAGTESRPGANPSSSAPAQKVKVETSSPFSSTGTPRPRKTAARLAGEASSGPRVPNQRSFATAIVMP